MDVIVKLVAYGEKAFALQYGLFSLWEKKVTSIRDIAKASGLSIGPFEDGQIERVGELEAEQFVEVEILSRHGVCAEFVKELCEKYKVSYAYSALSFEGELFEVVGDPEGDIFSDNFLLDVWDMDSELQFDEGMDCVHEFFETENDVVYYLKTHTNEAHASFLLWKERIEKLGCGKLILCRRQ